MTSSCENFQIDCETLTSLHICIQVYPKMMPSLDTTHKIKTKSTTDMCDQCWSTIYLGMLGSIYLHLLINSISLHTVSRLPTVTIPNLAYHRSSQIPFPWNFLCQVFQWLLKINSQFLHQSKCLLHVICLLNFANSNMNHYCLVTEDTMKIIKLNMLKHSFVHWKIWLLTWLDLLFSLSN